MSTVFKDVTIPFNITQMEELGETDTNIYIISYEKSQLRGEDFIKYIINSSKICDIVDYNNIDSDTKIKMMKRLFNQQELVFLPCMAKSFILALLTSKNIKLLPDDFKNSFLNNDEIIIFKDYMQDNFKNYIKFFDSLFIYMLIISSILVKNPQQEITYDDLISKYIGIKEIDDEKIIPVNVCSILFEPLFYRYYEEPINEKEIYFYKKQYTEKMFANKTIFSLLLNEANHILISLLQAMEKAKNIPERE